MRLDGLADRLREYGVEPREVAGCQTRGYDFPTPTPGQWIALRHWTAGGAGHAPSLGIIISGRSDLPGPLAQVTQARGGAADGSDLVYVVAEGIANHAGIGDWHGVFSGNSRGAGNEIEWSGPTEPFSPARQETSERVAAALLSFGNDIDGGYACEHREFAKPLGRKQDTNLDGNEMRHEADELLNAGGVSAPEPPKPVVPEDDFMEMVRQNGTEGLQGLFILLANGTKIDLTGIDADQVDDWKRLLKMRTGKDAAGKPTFRKARGVAPHVLRVFKTTEAPYKK